MTEINDQLVDWEHFYSSRVRRRVGLVNSYLYYVNRMLRKSVPPIFELAHLAELLGLSTHAVASMVNGPSSFYRSFTIPKRDGTNRSIRAPFPSLRVPQRWIMDNVLKQVPLHTSAHGGVIGRTIVSNVTPHLGQRQLLKVDVKDFFPSITLRRGVAVFRYLGYPRNVSFYLASICFLENCFPQGSLASPLLSNIICHRLDSRLAGLAAQSRLRYTRYIDDITFSGGNIAPRFITIVQNILASEGFVLNVNKTRLSRRTGRRIVTGISVISSLPKLPRSKKRDIKLQAFMILKRGYAEHSEATGLRDPILVERVLGRIAFWLQIEPESKTAKKLFNEMRSYSRQLTALEVD